MKKIRLFLVDDHQIVRDGIRALISDSDNVEIIGEASCGDELMEKLRVSVPDVLMLDISMPDMSGIEVTRNVIENYPTVQVLILSMYTNEEFIFNAIKAGARGYLPKNTTREELLTAVETVSHGKEYYSDSVSDIMLKSYVRIAKDDEKPQDKKDAALTTREIEILKLFAGGLSNQEIADKLFISIRTVESHKNHIMQKLDLKTPVDMVKYALRNKIAEL